MFGFHRALSVACLSASALCLFLGCYQFGHAACNVFQFFQHDTVASSYVDGTPTCTWWNSSTCLQLHRPEAPENSGEVNVNVTIKFYRWSGAQAGIRCILPAGSCNPFVHRPAYSDRNLALAFPTAGVVTYYKDICIPIPPT